MKTRRFVAGIAGVIALAGSVSVLAHHNTSSRYDEANPITLAGTVIRFRLINPHAQLEFEVKDEQGNAVKWTVEAGPASGMYRRGWRIDDLKPGDQVTVTGEPAFDGSKTMGLVKLVGPNGKVME
ncbi:MAG: DUF6152 family protein [Terriglobia bacterium]